MNLSSIQELSSFQVRESGLQTHFFIAAKFCIVNYETYGVQNIFTYEMPNCIDNVEKGFLPNYINEVRKGSKVVMGHKLKCRKVTFQKIHGKND
jgi:hypothetical protein